MPFNTQSLARQRVVVIGGTSGIGSAIADAAVAADARVTVIGRSAATRPGLDAVAADITDAAALARAFAAIGTIDHLVVTAGARVGSPKLDALRATNCSWHST